MSADENAALVRRLIEAVSNRNEDAIDELLADDHVLHSLNYQPVSLVDGKPVPIPEGGMTVTREQRRRNAAQQREEFPDARLAVDALYSADDMVTAVVTHRGTHRSGKAVTWKGIIIHRIDGGKVVELWGLWDRLGWWQQLGVVPETPELMRQIVAVR
jgi:ketosteroid isomerase-like protein